MDHTPGVFLITCLQMQNPYGLAACVKKVSVETRRDANGTTDSRGVKRRSLRPRHPMPAMANPIALKATTEWACLDGADRPLGNEI